MFSWFFTWYFSHTRSHWIFPVTLWGRYSYTLALQMKTWRLRGLVTTQGCRMAKWQRQGFNVGFLSPPFILFSLPHLALLKHSKQTHKKLLLRHENNPWRQKGIESLKMHSPHTLPERSLLLRWLQTPHREGSWSVSPAQAFTLSSRTKQPPSHLDVPQNLRYSRSHAEFIHYSLIFSLHSISDLGQKYYPLPRKPCQKPGKLSWTSLSPHHKDSTTSKSLFICLFFSIPTATALFHLPWNPRQIQHATRVPELPVAFFSNLAASM